MIATHLPTISRRQFVALSAAAAASATATTQSLASSNTNLPAPSLARVLPSPINPSTKRLQHISRATPGTLNPINNPTLTITPLSCISSRLTQDASLTIEALHPTPNLYSTILHAHNKDIAGESIPDFASTVVIKSPRNNRSHTTLRVTQHYNNHTQQHTLTLDASQPAIYLLAIPTASSASNAAWRLSTAHTNDNNDITHLTNPLRAASTHCVYLSITITDNPGE
jgi:hypothetical protein